MRKIKYLFYVILSFLILNFQILSKDINISKLKEGDIIFQETLSEQGTAIKLATKSRYTHVGLLFMYNQEMKVLEAVQPVKITNLRAFISRGKNSHFVVKRIKNHEAKLNPSTVSKMKSFGNSLLGKNYDLYFGWSNERIYCTELVWKIYKEVLDLEIGPLKTLGDFDLSASQVQSLMKKRYGNKIPTKEPVISPSDMFESEELIEVMRAN